jgi:hypothetical protein
MLTRRFGQATFDESSESRDKARNFLVNVLLVDGFQRLTALCCAASSASFRPNG